MGSSWSLLKRYKERIHPENKQQSKYQIENNSNFSVASSSVHTPNSKSSLFNAKNNIQQSTPFESTDESDSGIQTSSAKNAPAQFSFPTLLEEPEKSSDHDNYPALDGFALPATVAQVTERYNQLIDVLPKPAVEVFIHYVLKSSWLQDDFSNSVTNSNSGSTRASFIEDYVLPSDSNIRDPRIVQVKRRLSISSSTYSEGSIKKLHCIQLSDVFTRNTLIPMIIAIALRRFLSAVERFSSFSTLEQWENALQEFISLNNNEVPSDQTNVCTCSVKNCLQQVLKTVTADELRKHLKNSDFISSLQESLDSLFCSLTVCSANMADGTQWQYEYANNAFEALTGYTAVEVQAQQLGMNMSVKTPSASNKSRSSFFSTSSANTDILNAQSRDVKQINFLRDAAGKYGGTVKVGLLSKKKDGTVFCNFLYVQPAYGDQANSSQKKLRRRMVVVQCDMNSEHSKIQDLMIREEIAQLVSRFI